MFIGRSLWDSHGSLSSPAMTVWTDVHGNTTLVMVWCGSDGTMYFASGMEQCGAISVVPLQSSSLERPALTQFEDRLVLAYTGTNVPGPIMCSLSFDGRSFDPTQPWMHIDGSLRVMSHVTISNSLQK
jgi:hypothetical protein